VREREAVEGAGARQTPEAEAAAEEEEASRTVPRRRSRSRIRIGVLSMERTVRCGLRAMVDQGRNSTPVGRMMKLECKL
jgi:hypothetical protein